MARGSSLLAASAFLLAAASTVSPARGLRAAAPLPPSRDGLRAFATPAQVADDPFEETLSTRYPFAGSFPPAAVPTGWTQLGCGNASSVAVAGVSGAPSPLRPLLLCPSTTTPTPLSPLFDVLASSFAAVTGVDMTGGLWALAQPMSGAVDASTAWPVPLVAVGPTSAVLLTCAWQPSSSSTSCAAAPLVAAHNLSVVVFSGVYPSLTTAGAWTLLVGGVNGTLAFDFNPSLAPPAATLVFALPDYTAAASVSPMAGVLALGNSSTIAFRDARTGALLRWEWVTYVPTASGGPVDDIVTALAFDDAAAVPGLTGPVLYIGNPSCLNVAVLGVPGTGLGPDPFPVPVFDRISGPAGLPYGNISSLAIDLSAPPGRPAPAQPRRLFIGTAAGLAQFDPTATAEWGSGASAAPLRGGGTGGGNGVGGPVSVPFQQRWRWFAGGRWLPVTGADQFGSSVLSLLAYPLPASSCASGPPYPSGPCGAGLLALTQHGLADLVPHAYTLAAKAALFEAMLPTYNLSGTGLIAGCYAPSFGLLSACNTSPDDNSGLWTSLPAATFAAKYGVTGDPADAQRSRDWLAGLYVLNNVTGIQGLFARSALPPGVPPPPSAASAGTRETAAAGGCCPWHNSTALPGWTWKGDTSSDEVAGHVMAYAVAEAWLPQGELAGLAAATALHLARYVVGNNLTLVDVTGQPTTWGHWEPALINGNRFWSDERGLNAVEILAMLTTALAAVDVPGSGGGANDTAVLTQAIDALLAPAIGYGENMVNAKIIVPDDDNYSDDELLFFSYFPLLLSTESAAPGSPAHLARQYAFLSLARSWSEIAFSRPSIWNVIAMGMFLNDTQAGAGAARGAAAAQAVVAARIVGGGGPLGPVFPDPDAAMADAVWNLRTWPLETLDWPVLNSVRLDVPFYPEVDRDLQSHTQSLGILPGNERVFSRWNGNPRTLDGGSGTSATDPAAFLMPYWLARRFGFLAGPAAAG